MDIQQELKEILNNPYYKGFGEDVYNKLKEQLKK